MGSSVTTGRAGPWRWPAGSWWVPTACAPRSPSTPSLPSSTLVWAPAPRVQKGVAPAGVRTFTGRPGFVRRAWGPGWALVGDAGYWKDPLTAHGLTDALRDADLLARAVLAYQSGACSEGDALSGFQ